MKQCFTRDRSKFLLLSKNEFCATKFVAKMAFSVSYCHKELFLRCSRHSGSASDGNTWQKVIFIWRKQPSKLIKQPFMEAVIRLYGNSIRLTAFRG